LVLPQEVSAKAKETEEAGEPFTHACSHKHHTGEHTFSPMIFNTWLPSWHPLDLANQAGNRHLDQEGVWGVGATIKLFPHTMFTTGYTLLQALLVPI